MTYAEGFAAGERQAYRDRQSLDCIFRPEFVITQWQRGFWDGYSARNPQWQMARPRPTLWCYIPKEIH